MTQVTPTMDREPTRLPRHESAFFSWIRRLGIPRLPGWLGGVCAGIAARIGIDPLIVRGIFVVAALLGLPALLVYAMAWALLPGTDGRIPLQQLARGHFDPALIAIAIMVVVGLLPIAGGLWLWAWAVPGFSLYDGLQAVVFSPLFFWAAVIAVVILIVWLIIRAITRSRGGSVPVPRSASADAAAPGPLPAITSAHAEVGDDDAPAEPTIEADAPHEAVAQWRAQHEQWRIEHNAWRRRQAGADAAALQIARAEREASARAFAAEAAERRRIRRATNPRASAVYVLAVIGAGLVGGALTLLAIDDGMIGSAAGLLVAGLVSAVGMVIAGAARRRSGFLAFLTALFVAVGVVGGFAATTPNLVWGNVHVSSISSQKQSYLQPFGETSIHIWQLGESFDAAPIVVRKGTGHTAVYVEPGTTLELSASLGNGVVEVLQVDTADGNVLSTSPLTAKRTSGGVSEYTHTIETPDADDAMTTVPVVIDQREGSVQIIVQVLKED